MDRSTLPLHSFRTQSTSPEIVAGRDGLHHGTWLGINDLGYIAAVTNNRELPRNMVSGGESRGMLALDALATADRYPNVSEYVRRRVEPCADLHPPFNLLLIDSVLDEICCFGTHDAVHRAGERIDEPALALSNGTVHSNWFKMRRGLRMLAASLGADDSCDGSRLVERILGVLLDRMPASDPQELPHNTCLTAELEERLSPIFVMPFSIGPHGWDGAEAGAPNAADRQFGTVSSTIVLIDRNATLATVYEFDWRQAAAAATTTTTTTTHLPLPSPNPVTRQLRIRRPSGEQSCDDPCQKDDGTL